MNVFWELIRRLKKIWLCQKDDSNQSSFWLEKHVWIYIKKVKEVKTQEIYTGVKENDKFSEKVIGISKNFDDNRTW